MKKNVKSILLALVVMALWGSLFPCVKLSYKAFGISSSSIPDILMFAAVRFTLCGLIVCGFALVKKEKLAAPKSKSMAGILLMGLFSVVLHYGFNYVGMATTDSSKTALIKQLGPLLYACFAFLFFKGEKFSIYKILGAVIGFGGIVAINIENAGISFSFGVFMIILASVCTVTANIVGKSCSKNNSPYWVTGISQLSGGLILLIAALVMGADFPTFTPKATLLFAYICTASVISYTLWYYILGKDSLSKLFIIKFAEPLFACLFSAFLLGEEILKPQYLVAFLLISAGILLGNRSEAKQK